MSRTLFTLPGIALAVLALTGCLFEPEIGDEWTRLDILEPHPDGETLRILDTTPSIEFHGRVTYRAIRTGDLIVQIRVSDTLGYDDVRLEPGAPREAMLGDVERVLAGSRAVASASVLATGWDRLMRDVHLSIPLDGRLQHGPEGGVFLVFYLGTADRMENPDGSETIRFEAFDFRETEILPVGLELRTEAAPPAPAAASVGAWQPTLRLGGGAIFLDPHLVDYQWSADPASVASGEVGVRHRAWRTGVRVSRWSGVQAVTGADPDRIRVNQTALQVALRRRVLGSERMGLSAGMLVGGLRLSYSPDRANPGLPGDGGKVHFAPAWSLLTGVELGLHGAVSRSLQLGIDGGRHFFALETAHRRGDDIVYADESFSGWHCRGRLTWTAGGLGS